MKRQGRSPANFFSASDMPQPASARKPMKSSTNQPMGMPVRLGSVTSGLAEEASHVSKPERSSA